MEAARRGAVVAVVVACGFGFTWLATGELNYQGGERKTFYDRYPFDPGVSFDSAGVWMATDHLGPLVAGRDDDKQSVGSRRSAQPAELRRSFFRLNLGYFWVGRFAGRCPYFPGFAGALALFLLLAGPRERHGWLALRGRSRGLVAGLHPLIIPDNWYGGAGHDRQPLLPQRRSRSACCSCRAGGALAPLARRVARRVLLLPLLASPVRHSLRPGEHATLARAFRLLPAELTMLGDLSVFTDVWRKRRPYNPPGGDAARRAAGRAAAVLPVVPRRRHLRPGDIVRRGGLLAARRRERRGGAAGARPGVARAPGRDHAGPRGTS